LLKKHTNICFKHWSYAQLLTWLWHEDAYWHFAPHMWELSSKSIYSLKVMQFINNQQVKTRGVNKVKVLPFRIKEWLKWKRKNQWHTSRSAEFSWASSSDCGSISIPITCLLISITTIATKIRNGRLKKNYQQKTIQILKIHVDLYYPF